jgi:hypothetical protein
MAMPNSFLVLFVRVLDKFSLKIEKKNLEDLKKNLEKPNPGN